MVLTEIQEQIEPRLGPAGDLHSIADWTGRHHGRVARIAGLLHLCEHSPNESITESTMHAALRIGDYLLEHGTAALTGPDAGLRSAIRWLEKRGEPCVTQRDLHRGPLAGRGTAEEAAVLTERLEALGVLRRTVVEHTRPGRPASAAYDVHPDLIRAQPGGLPRERPVPTASANGNSHRAPVVPPTADEVKESLDNGTERSPRVRRATHD